MRFNSILANKFRKFGNIVVAKEVSSGYYDIYIKYPNNSNEYIQMERNKALAIKVAKVKAMELKLGFNQETDVYY